MAYTQEQLQEAYRKLPKDIQDAIFSVDVAEAIKAIGEKYKLMIDKIGELADETGLVMLGFTHPSQFVSHLADRLEIDKTIAKEIAEEINLKVFSPIRENLKKIHGMKEEATEEAGQTASLEAPQLKENVEKAFQPSPLSTELKTPETPPSPTLTLQEEVEAATPSALRESAEPKTDVKITPPIITSMPVDLTRAQKTEAAEPLPSESHPIFEAKTKEEPFRSPAEIIEKKIPALENTGAEIPPTSEESSAPKANIKIDPYREPIP